MAEAARRPQAVRGDFLETRMRSFTTTAAISAAAAVLIAFVLPTTAIAQASAPPAPCAKPEYRQFDFWRGDWEVLGGPDGDRIVGHNRISAVSGGCALHEHWRAASGGEGHSLNVYDRDRGRWTQFWIGADGGVLRLEGGLRADGAMAMEGVQATPRGPQRQRIVWTPRANGSVEQRWETSDDDGAQWRTIFLGVYRRRSADGCRPQTTQGATEAAPCEGIAPE
jgi:hypothetical protein